MTTRTMVLIIEEDLFFYPRFVAELLAHAPVKITGLLIASAPRKHNRSWHLLKKIRHFRLRELMKLGWKYARLRLRNDTLERLARESGIPYLHARGSANTPEVIAWLKELQPDIIFSASPLILKEEILAIPRISINMHFSLLPSYKGIMPLFHAMANGEVVSGISLHEMIRKIDEGRVLYQREVKLDYTVSLFENYMRFFALAVPCVSECLNGLDTERRYASSRPASYFGHPDDTAWANFRARGMAFI